MASALFSEARKDFAMGNIRWRSDGGDPIKVLAVSPAYEPDKIRHKILSDIQANLRCGNDGGRTINDFPSLVLIDPIDGICDAEDGSDAFIPTVENFNVIISVNTASIVTQLEPQSNPDLTSEGIAQATKNKLQPELNKINSFLTEAQATMLLEMYRLMGLDPTKPLIVTQTLRTAGDGVTQEINVDMENETTTVTRV